ncbi:hypothetical protein [Rivularia sp. UHCC 0363]|uniref:hypothetical protein n=1 Tax=Rivularia sp. UHCC 0363 TaxID=3110244 RepID=UPI002B1FCA07|nr:hypothetical protein [Rivularia sp. UHCC 0363]MEA5598624.1 hypothetical protein [Rivularia sp. UHCC 0363]
MGLTIHYSFSLNNATIDKAREKVVALHKLALKLPFKNVDDLVEIAGDDCYFDKHDVDDPYVFIKIRALKPVQVAKDGFSWKDPTYIIGFDSLPGDGSETPIFGLATHSEVQDINDWSWTGFCKTQYASNPEYGGLENFLKCHLLIVKMLDAACELGITCDVSDESGYWDNRSIEELAETIRQYNGLMAAFTGEMKDHLDAAGITSTKAPIFDYPNFEYLEADGQELSEN